MFYLEGMETEAVEQKYPQLQRRDRLRGADRDADAEGEQVSTRSVASTGTASQRSAWEAN